MYSTGRMKARAQEHHQVWQCTLVSPALTSNSHDGARRAVCTAECSLLLASLQWLEALSRCKLYYLLTVSSSQTAKEIFWRLHDWSRGENKSERLNSLPQSLLLSVTVFIKTFSSGKHNQVWAGLLQLHTVQEQSSLHTFTVITWGWTRWPSEIPSNLLVLSVITCVSLTCIGQELAYNCKELQKDLTVVTGFKDTQTSNLHLHLWSTEASSLSYKTAGQETFWRKVLAFSYILPRQPLLASAPLDPILHLRPSINLTCTQCLSPPRRKDCRKTKQRK